MGHQPGTVTGLLADARGGSQNARDRLWVLVLAELEAVAKGKLRREGPGNEYDTAALVSETCLRMFGRQLPPFVSRKHFYCYAARVMANILHDQPAKPPPPPGHPPAAAGAGGSSNDDERTRVREAMTRLEAIMPRPASVVYLRYFVGLTVRETATCLEVSPATVESDFHFARAWLHRELQG